jgi:hypothetical protein
MAVTTAGVTSPIVGTLPAMRVRETWHAFCYLPVNQRKSLSINHLGACQARKSLNINALHLAQKMNLAITDLARFLITAIRDLARHLLTLHKINSKKIKLALAILPICGILKT